jgi:D-alanyl-D-alanine carboxypeptidase
VYLYEFTFHAKALCSAEKETVFMRQLNTKVRPIQIQNTNFYGKAGLDSIK